MPLRRFWHRLVTLPDPVATGGRAFMLFIGLVVGLYAGLVAVLFRTLIDFFHVLFYRSGELLALFGGGGAATREAVRANLESTAWTPVLGLSGGTLAILLVALHGARTRHLDAEGAAPSASHGRLLRSAAMIAIWMLLYYGLLFARAFVRAFEAGKQPLLAILEAAPWYAVVLIPAVGALLVPFVRRYAPETAGSGVENVIEAAAIRGGRMRARTAAAKTLASAITLGSGGSAGREGPTIQIGASIASWLGQRLTISGDRLRILLGAGAAGGLAAAFNAPIAGAMFAVEVVVADFAVTSFAPIVVAAVSATAVSRTFYGSAQEFPGIHFELASHWEVFLYGLLGLVLGLLGVALVRTIELSRRFFDRELVQKRGLPLPLVGAVGGLSLGAIALLVPNALGNGYETINLALGDHLAIGMLLAIAAAKLLATGITLGCGGAGGTFAPSLVLGATVSGAFGATLYWVSGGATAPGSDYAAVGMGAMVAGTTGAPITAILMLFELTHRYEIILPLMVTSVVATVVVHQTLGGDSIYTRELRKRGVNLRAGRDVSVLGSLRVGSVMEADFVALPAGMRFRDILRQLAGSLHTDFVVVDDAGVFIGMISVQDFREFVFDEELEDLVVAQDLINEIPTRLRPEDDLQAAIAAFSGCHFDHLPVVSSRDETRVVALVSRADVMRAYHRALAMR